MISATASASRPVLMQHPLASLAVFALLAATVHAQDPSTPAPPPQNPPASFCAQEPGERRVSVGLLPKNILCDQKNIWLFPIRAPHHRRWIPALAVISFTAVLVATDAHSAGYFRSEEHPLRPEEHLALSHPRAPPSPLDTGPRGHLLHRRPCCYRCPQRGLFPI